MRAHDEKKTPLFIFFRLGLAGSATYKYFCNYGANFVNYYVSANCNFIAVALDEKIISNAFF